MMYILDEPSIGLHPKDNAMLIEMLRKLRDKGNSVLVVEHDPDIIRSADWLIDIGPEAGKNGGHVLFTGYTAICSMPERSPAGISPKNPYLLSMSEKNQRILFHPECENS